MIDEKRLMEISQYAPSEGWQSDKPVSVRFAPIHPDEMCELIRLAAVGLWAEMVGIPALKHYAAGAPVIGYDRGEQAREALAKLPKVGT